MFSQTWKSVEEVDKNLMEMLNAQNYNVTDYFKSTDSAVPKTPTNPDDEKKKRDTEIYYFEVCLWFFHRITCIILGAKAIHHTSIECLKCFLPC